MMRSRSLISFFLVSLVVLVGAGCGPAPAPVTQAPDTRDEDLAAIQAASKAWSDADRARDLTKCLSFYADDAERMEPGSYLISGQEDLRRSWEQHLAETTSFSWIAKKIEVAREGDFAYERGAYESKSVNAKKQPVTTTGKYVFVWKKQDDGKWKVIEDISNPDT